MIVQVEQRGDQQAARTASSFAGGGECVGAQHSRLQPAWCFSLAAAAVSAWGVRRCGHFAQSAAAKELTLCEGRTNLGTEGLISTDRGTKPTLMLTIPRSMQSRLQRIYLSQHLKLCLSVHT
jgi:hypothetical protein